MDRVLRAVESLPRGLMAMRSRRVRGAIRRRPRLLFDGGLPGGWCSKRESAAVTIPYASPERRSRGWCRSISNTPNFARTSDTEHWLCSEIALDKLDATAPGGTAILGESCLPFAEQIGAVAALSKYRYRN